MKILIINGYQKHEFSDGKLNTSLSNYFYKKLKDYHKIRFTTLELGYTIQEERNKFFWADIVIFQFPIYWFSATAELKRYMDDVFEYEQFYAFGEDYGTGGLLTDKKYLLSTTWNAPEDVFNKTNKFFEGKSVDDILVSVHKALQFCGMKPLPSFSVHNVVKNPQYGSYIENLDKHIQKVFYVGNKL